MDQFAVEMDLHMTQYNSTLNRGFNSLDESCIFFNGWTSSLEKKKFNLYLTCV